MYIFAVMCIYTSRVLLFFSSSSLITIFLPAYSLSFSKTQMRKISSLDFLIRRGMRGDITLDGAVGIFL